MLYGGHRRKWISCLRIQLTLAKIGAYISSASYFDHKDDIPISNDLMMTQNGIDGLRINNSAYCTSLSCFRTRLYSWNSLCKAKSSLPLGEASGKDRISFGIIVIDRRSVMG